MRLRDFHPFSTASRGSHERYSFHTFCTEAVAPPAWFDDEKPSLIGVTEPEITLEEEAVVVESVDITTGAVVLQEPEGRKRILNAPVNAQGLERVNAGDKVVIQQIDALTISVAE